MIRNYDNTDPNLSFPPECIERSLLSGIKHIFFVKRTFSFSSESDFQDVDIWRQAITDGDIIPVFNNLEFEDNSDPDMRELNKQDYFYRKSPGKYRFLHHFNYTYYYAVNVKELSEKDYDYIFSDRNGNILGYSEFGTTVRGFDTDSIIIEKMTIGTGSVSNWTKIFVELSDADQLDKNAVIYTPDWSINRNLRIVPVDVTNITEGSVQFRVTDSIYNSSILGLISDNVTVNDNAGVITFTSFKSLGGGYYLLDGLSGSLTYGTVDVASNIYYGYGNYAFVNAPVNIINLVFNSLTDIEFDVRLASDNSIITGLLTGDFTITDDTHGVVSIGSFLELPDGHYRLSSLGNSLTTGDIDISSGDYLGTQAYSANVDVEVYDFTSDGTNVIYCKVRESVSLDAVTGLLTVDFDISDTINTTVSIVTVVETATGEYTIYLDGAKTSGDVDIVNLIYTGSDAYDFTGPTVANGGYTAGGATDWVDSDADGKADGVLDQGMTGKTFTISSNPGFTGDIQRIDFVSTVLVANCVIRADYFKPGTAYYATCKFRSDKNFRMSAVAASFSEYVDGTGDDSPHTIQTGSFTPAATDQVINLQFVLTETVSSTAYFEIDEVFLIEV